MEDPHHLMLPSSSARSESERDYLRIRVAELIWAVDFEIFTSDGIAYEETAVSEAEIAQK